MMVLVRALELGRNVGSDVAFSLTFVLGSLLKPFTVILAKFMPSETKGMLPQREAQY